MTTETANPYPSVPVASSSNLPGRVSLVLGIIIVVIGAVQQVVVQLIPTILYNAGLDSSAIGAIFGVFGAVEGVIAVVALILGIIGLQRTWAPRLAAAAGTAIAATTLLSVVLGLFLPLILSAVL